MGYDTTACALAVVLLLPSAIVTCMLDPTTRYSIVQRGAVGVAAFLATVLLVPILARFTERKGLFGKDLGKRNVPALRDVRVPEALGIVSSLAFLVSVILCMVAFASTFEEKANYNSALTSVCFMVLLGFMDDVLDLPWRAKLILPTIASMPLLITYTGPTSIVVPKPIKGSPETARHLTDEGLLRPPIGAPPAVQLLTRRISFSSSPSCASGRISPGCLLTPNAASEPKMPARVDTPGLSKHKRSASPFITIKPPPASLDTLRNINLMVNRVQQASTRGRVRSNGRTPAAAKAAAAKADKDAKEGKEGKAQKSEHGAEGGEKAEVPPGKAEEVPRRLTR